MSFITNSLIKPIAQWYSEINSATLTGAIDVLVIEQEDGSFLSSPFHVRFGKVGVLKANQKIVDIEINDEPVEIHLKLDDHGVAFFVEDVSDSEDEEIPPELATSPIPSLSYMEQARPPGYNDNEEEKIGSSVNRSLIQEFNAIEEKVANEEETADKQQTAAIPESASTSSLNCKGKQNRKKRKRRNKGHARNGSKSSLKDVAALATASSSESGEGGKQEIVATAEDKELFEMEDNDNDGDCDDDENESTPMNSVVVASTPIKTNKTADSTEQSFLQSRLGNSAFDSLLDSQEHMHREEKESRATAATMDYFSEPEMTSPQGSRPPTPVQSDTEYETKREKKKSAVAGEQSWEWGKLPMSAKDAAAKDAAAKDEKDGQKSEEDGATKINVDSTDGAAGGSKRRWTFSSFWKSGENNSKNRDRRQVGVPGVYLDDLKDDEEMMAIYVGSVGRRTSENNPLLPYDDDDAESGTGASLPMSPHSVDGAIGGARLMAPGSAPKGHYDSSDDEQRAAKHIFSEIALSLCGGLDQPDKEFSPLLFEQGLLSYDDYVLRLRDTDLFTHPDLVVRIGNKYYTWQAASPIIMSVALYGQKLPNELVEDKESKAGASSSSPSSGSKQPPSRSSSWWPFGSRKPDGRGAGGEPRIPEGEDLEAGVSQTDAAAPMSIAPPVSLEAVTEAEGQADKLIGEAVNNAAAAAVTTTTTSGESRSRTRFDTSGSTTGSEGDHELKLKIKRKEKKYKKTLRLSSDQIVKLNLKPGANEAQFSVTTAYQGTSRCNCHIYWWKHTDKIVVSDIDGTITKSDVLGHVMPIIGRDWAQSGVASLFTKIVANSYQIIYLSSRAIGQAGITKDYLATIRQGDVNLPDGPLFLNPTSLVNAFHREVIEKKPEKFKIACLRDIQKLFPSNPLYAGYGNRVNDVFAYRTVGIPISRVFTINSKGELRHELTQTFQTSYDCQSSLVDHIFPPLSGVQNSPSTHQEYSTFAYWREPIIDIQLNKQMEQQKIDEMAQVVTDAVQKDKEDKVAAAVLTSADAAKAAEAEKPAEEKAA